MWNNLYTWWSMCVGNQNFPVSWGHNFVCSLKWIRYTDVKQMIEYTFVRM